MNIFDGIAIFLVVLSWMVVPVFLVGTIILISTFPHLFRKLGIFLGLIISFGTGLVAFIIAWKTFPFILAFIIYFIGIFIHILGPKHWGRLKIWRDVFKAATVTIGITWISVYLGFGFLAFQDKSRQSEVITNLSSIATAEISYYAEKHCYSNRFSDIVWEPYGTRHYSYYFSTTFESGTFFEATNKIPYNSKPYWETSNKYPSYVRCRKYFIIKSERQILFETAAKYGIGVSSDNFLAIAIGNIDNDPDWDVWIIDKTKYPKNVIKDLGFIPGAITTLNLWVAELYDDGFAIFPDRITVILFIVNLILWITFSLLVKKAYLRNTANDRLDKPEEGEII